MNDITTTTKVTKLTASNVSALEGWADDLKVTVGKTTATFEGTASEAATRVRGVQEKIAAKQGRQAGPYASLHAVARKLENGKDTVTTTASDETVIVETEHHEAPAPKLTLVADSTDPESLVKIPGLDISVPANPKGVFGPSVKDAVEEEKAKRTAQQAADEILASAGYEKKDDSKPTWGTAKHHGLKKGDLFLFYGTNDKEPKAEPTVRNFDQARIGGVAKKFWAAKSEPKKAEKPASGTKAAPAKKSAGSRAIPQEAANKARQAWIAENGLETYKKQYNGGWDNATYGQGEKKAKSGEASPAWMDGYTDRTANPGKEGIKAKWAALSATTAPVKKIS